MWKSNLLILFFVLLFVALTIGLSGYKDVPVPDAGTSLELPYEGDLDDDASEPRTPNPSDESPFDPDEPEIFEAAL
ncbi:MAG: hypothetical protein LBI74_02625 [Synergistaceae bacterium]|jgi:hypothetical protein|nr:hypothetical protein [Synergistaceae bacterium]